MHVAEQPAEVEACVAETKLRPVELLAEHELLCERFVAVHATHITNAEARLLGQSGAYACICPTTERDLGDGLPDLGALVEQGVRLCLGVDGYAMCDPFEEMRGLVLGERLRTGRRFGAWPAPARPIWKAASDDGALALGFDDAGGYLEIRKDALALELVSEDHWVDALVFSGSPSLVDRVVRRC
jgi:formimidoylglutamate deiminase